MRNLLQRRGGTSHGLTALSTVAFIFNCLGEVSAVDTPPLGCLEPGLDWGPPPDALPKRPTANDLKFQPILDFDTDSCYNVPAIDSKGNISKGQPYNYTHLSSFCHDESDLDNNNVYSRSRCNGNEGRCIYLYDYFFEKDVQGQCNDNFGHTYDWEHIAVWVRNGEVTHVAASQHGGYDIKPVTDSDVLMDGTHPKMVYHKDGIGTHCFRFGNNDDNAHIENDKGKWWQGDLVSYNGFPAGIRDKLYTYDFQPASMATKDTTFANNINEARPKNGDDWAFDFDPDHDNSQSPGTPGDNLPKLRIQALGDSITQGSLSSNLNGYRGPLRDMLTDRTDVDMIGSRADGSMMDNQHEGHSGKYLGNMTDYSLLSIKARPNVVLFHAGTNNVDKQVDLDNMYNLLTATIRRIVTAAPDAVVIVAKIIMINEAATQKRVDAYNKQVELAVHDLQFAGDHVTMVDMSDILTANDLADKKHPNDSGYKKMAAAWYNAILDANLRGWLKGPVEPETQVGVGLGTGQGQGGSDYSCSGKNWEKIGSIFEGPRTWIEMGQVTTAQPNGRRDKVILTDLNGDGFADYVLADDDGTVRAWLNNGDGKSWTGLGTVNPPWTNVNGSNIRMADVDNDGCADLIVVYSDGAAKVWKNTGKGKKFEALDSKWATGLGDGGKVHIVDLDGDGYADYVMLFSNGVVKYARNTHNNGKNQNVKNWETEIQVAPGPTGMPANAAHLFDIDGDGKADYVIVYDDGSVGALRNTGNLNADTSKRNWEDWKIIAPGVSGVTANMIRFAPVTGDLGDFIAVADDGTMKVWHNTGIGITVSKKDSLRFADLNNDGYDDIIAVNHKGAAYAWLNHGGEGFQPYAYGAIAPGPSEDVSASRIEFADVNGDGNADYLLIYGGGAVKAFLSRGQIGIGSASGRIWEDGVVIAPGIADVPGSMVRFADLSGDGYPDFLVVWDGGAVDAYLNEHNWPMDTSKRVWSNKATVAPGVGQPGNKLQFADIDGDGAAEYLVVFEGGAIDAYLNNGNIPDADLPRTWISMGTIAAGVSPQGMVRLADINGDGKADYLSIFDDGSITAYINTCSWKPHS